MHTHTATGHNVDTTWENTMGGRLAGKAEIEALKWGCGTLERYTIHNDMNYKAMAMNNLTDHCREENKQGILNLGCSHHYLLLAAPYRNRRETRNPFRVTIPNGKAIESTHEGELKIEALPEATRHVHILPGLANHSLVSVCQLCNSGCQVMFRADKVLMYDALKKVIMVG